MAIISKKTSPNSKSDGLYETTTHTLVAMPYDIAVPKGTAIMSSGFGRTAASPEQLPLTESNSRAPKEM